MGDNIYNKFGLRRTTVVKISYKYFSSGLNINLRDS